MKLNIKDTFNKELPADKETTNTRRQVFDACFFPLLFLQLCKPGAAERIEAETPGDGIVCKDGGERGRAAIHREVSDRIVAFLAKALP